MNPRMLPTLACAALAAGLFAFMPVAAAMPLVAPLQEAGDGYVVRVHGTNTYGPHCRFAWSTSYGWHVHGRHCDLPQYNPDWRDPRHWHWRLYEQARERRLQQGYRHHRLRRGYKY